MLDIQNPHMVKDSFLNENSNVLNHANIGGTCTQAKRLPNSEEIEVMGGAAMVNGSGGKCTYYLDSGDQGVEHQPILLDDNQVHSSQNLNSNFNIFSYSPQKEN